MLKRLYEKSEIGFALMWIGIYIFAFSAADSISTNLQIEKIVTAPIGAAITLFLLCWLGKNNLLKTYGICKWQGSARSYLYFAPLLLIASANIWYGFAMNMSALESVLNVIAMLCVGFIEEVVFRGFLFKAMERDNVKTAIIVSSLTFGIGHIINLLSGAPVMSTVLQICYACAAGFLFVAIFHRSGSLLPCIATHCVINSMSTFINEENVTLWNEIVIAVMLTIVSAIYAAYVLRTKTK